MIWRVLIWFGFALAACSSEPVEDSAREIAEIEVGDAASESVSASPPSSELQAVEQPEVSLEVPDERPSLVEGTATMFRPATVAEVESDEGLDRGPEGELRLESCRWRGPGLYSFDMSWTPIGDLDWPVTILVTQTILRGDVGTGWGGYVTVDGPGEFSIPYNAYEANRLLGQEGIDANRSTVNSEQNVQCYLDDPVPVELDPLSVEPGPEGTIEQLVSQMEVESALLPLSVFVPQAAQLEIDRLFIAMTGSLERLNASRRGDCLSIRSLYLTEPDVELFVEQTLRCPEAESSEPGKTVVIADEVWRVTATGPAGVVEEFASGIEDLPFAGVDRLEVETGSFDADAAIEARIAESGFTEIARVPWDDGLVSIGFSNADFIVERYSDPIVAVPERFGGGGFGTGCEDYAIVEQGDSARGFGFVVVEDGNHAVVRDVGGEQVVVPTIPAAGGRAIVFFDNAQRSDINVPSLFVVDDAGEVVPCVQ